MRKLFLLFLSATSFFPAFSQDVMTVLPDSGKNHVASNYIGFKLFAADFSASTLNEDIQFRYVSLSNNYVMKHDMNLKGLTNMPNIGLGVEETLNKHLFINFLNITLGYTQKTSNWTGGIGVGYSTPLNKKNNIVLRAYLNLFYENITYGLGTYSDSTLIGFEINGVNIGTYVKNIKYANNMLCVNPTLDLVYRGKNFDYFFNAGYCRTLLYKEKLDFYRTHITIGSALYNENGNAVNKGAILPGNYTLQVGIIREFGL